MRTLLCAISVAFASAAATMLISGPAQASAQYVDTSPVCSTDVVYDRADVLDDAKVERAAAEFGDGVVVKVVAFERIPGSGDLYDALLDLRAQCAGWGFATGGGQSLLVLGVATADRELGSHYDGADLGRFDSYRDRAEVDAMGARFGNGDWTGGMVAGLETYAEAYRTPVDTTVPEPGAPGTSSDATADDGSGGLIAWVLLVPLGALSAAGAAFGGFVLYRRRKATRAARASLVAATNEMAQAWVELDDSREYIDARVQSLPAVDDTLVNRIHAEHARATAALEKATATYLSTAETYSETAIAEMDAEQSDTAVPSVKETTEELRRAKTAMTAVEQAVTDLETLRNEIPVRVSTLREQASTVTALLGQRRGQGYMTGDFDDAPTAAEQAAQDSERLAEQLRFGDAEAALDAATVTLQEQHAWLTGLDEYRDALAADTVTLHQRAEALDDAIAEAYVTLETLERDFDASCLDGVRDRTDAAKLARSKLNGALSIIETNSSMATQQFRVAREQIADAKRACDHIAADAAAASAREEQLSTLLTQLPLTAQSLEADADALGELVASNATAMSYLSHVPAAAEFRSAAVALGERAKAPKAPLLAVESDLADLEAHVTRASRSVTGAIDDYETAQQAVSAAASAASAAESECQHPDVSRASRQNAVDSAVAVTRAQGLRTLAEITRAANSAKDAAYEAAARARRDKREAQQRRDAARRRSSSTGSSLGGSSRGSLGGGGSRRSGGGGSRSFGGGGSRRSGGGGSRKF